MYSFIFEHMREEGVEYVKVRTGGDDAHLPARRAYEKARFDRGVPSVTYYRKI